MNWTAEQFELANRYLDLVRDKRMDAAILVSRELDVLTGGPQGTTRLVIAVGDVRRRMARPLLHDPGLVLARREDVAPRVRAPRVDAAQAGVVAPDTTLAMFVDLLECAALGIAPFAVVLGWMWTVGVMR